MKTSRRSMIRLGLCAAGSFVTFFEGLSGTALAAMQQNAGTENAGTQADEGYWLRRDMFEATVNQQFIVRARPQSISLRLVRVEDVSSARNAGTVDSQDCFSVVFRGSRSSQLEQGTYPVENSVLGAFLLFIVPGPPSAGQPTYVATFNRVPMA